MSCQPLVTVLMSVHDDRRFLCESVESILAQSLREFEFIVTDDGSTDGSGEYLDSIPDPRLRVIRNASNLGLTRSLNIGLDAARGKYVARMDADDVAAPHRLRRQVQFMEAQRGVGIVGTSRTLIDEGGRVIAEAPAATDDLRIRWRCLLGNPLAHPTVMLRREVLDRHKLRYDERFETAQDYELWSRLLPITKAANLGESLLRYRLRAGVSRTRKAEQLENHDRVAHAAIRRLVPRFEIGPEEMTNLRGRFGGHSVRDPDMDPGDPRWVARYAELLDAFSSGHAKEPGIAAFRAAQRGALAA